MTIVTSKLFWILVLSSENPRLIEYALTCLKTIFSHRSAPKDMFYDDPALIQRLLVLMNESIENKISVASILSDACLVKYSKYLFGLSRIYSLN